jgi:hypothetical protein
VLSRRKQLAGYGADDLSEATIWAETARYSWSAFFRQRSEGRAEYFVGHQIGSQQPLEDQSFDQGVNDAHELAGWGTIDTFQTLALASRP